MPLPWNSRTHTGAWHPGAGSHNTLSLCREPHIVPRIQLIYSTEENAHNIRVEMNTIRKVNGPLVRELQASENL